MTLQERFMLKVSVEESGCWIWTAARYPSGYGAFAVQSGMVRGAHRVSHLIFKGPIPDGLTIDHLCGVRHCVNPAHLEAVSIRENVQRWFRQRPPREFCVEGHALTGDNALINKKRDREGVREVLLCRICTRRKRREAYRRRQTVAA